MARPDPARPAPLLMKRRALGSSAVPGSHGFGDQPSQHTADAAWRLRDPGAAAAPRGERAAPQIAPARSGHWPGSGRQAVRLEYDHHPDAPAATCAAWGRACQGCTLVMLLRTLADGSAKCAVYQHGLESQLRPHTPHPGASGGRPALARPGGAWELRWLLPHLPVTSSVIWRCSTTTMAST